MSQKIKHLILAFLSLVLLLSTLLVPMPVKNDKDMNGILFGYPLVFIEQNFSDYIHGFSFFPRWQKFEYDRPISDFSAKNFILSFSAFFLAVEILIFALETLKYWILKIFRKE